MVGLALNILCVNCIETIYMAVKSFSDHKFGRDGQVGKKGDQGTINGHFRIRIA